MKYRKILLTILVLVFLFGWLAFLFWKQGEPYQEPYWSPNHRYYLQKYSNLTLSNFLPMMPGQGSDSINGYIRLYDAKGNLLYERFETFIRDITPVWADNRVYLLGVAEMDNDPWILPTSSE
ncbi:MAG: hypothetical protein AB1489_38610 [Acidobacteriota bacterium]